VQAPDFSFYVVSCYFQYSEIEEPQALRDDVSFADGEETLSRVRRPMLGRHSEIPTDERGAKLVDLIQEFGLHMQ